MSTIVIFLLITYSVSLAIATAKPLTGVRNLATSINRGLGQIFLCPACLSFWISFPAYYRFFGFFNYNTVPFAFLAFGFSYWMVLLETKLK